jgi:hypothetical protein
MNLVSMKLTPAEAKKDSYLSDPDPADAPEYPYGLTIQLCDDDLAKLGITDIPEVGVVMELTAAVVVCNTSQYENQEGQDKSITLQITDMGLSASSGTSIADRLYGG